MAALVQNTVLTQFTRAILVRADSIFLRVHYERCKIRIFVTITAVRSRVKPAAARQN